MNFGSDVVSKALTLMWQGMLGIFVVLGILSLVVLVFTKINSGKKTDEN